MFMGNLDYVGFNQAVNTLALPFRPCAVPVRTCSR
jgi:hypothetical protein